MDKLLLGDRMKNNYENRTRYKLPCRSYFIIRIDGKNFSILTRGLNKPYDENLIKAMDETAATL